MCHVSDIDELLEKYPETKKPLTKGVPMKILIVLSLALGSIAHAESTYSVNGKEASKLDVIRALLANPNAKATRCSEVELTDKATLKNKKIVKVVKGDEQ